MTPGLVGERFISNISAAFILSGRRCTLEPVQARLFCPRSARVIAKESLQRARYNIFHIRKKIDLFI